MTLDNIVEEINKAEKVVVLTHESPDGDAIGSVLAMNLALKSLGKQVDVRMKEFPRRFSFLPRANEVKFDLEEKEYDLAISVDCADLKRLERKEYFENAKVSIVIDHHGSNMMYGDWNFVNPVSPACCEILAGIFEYANIEITKEIGTCLLTGIITDTGGFRYQGVTSETFEFAAELLRKGVKISDVYEKVLQTQTKPNFELSKRVINRMELLEDGKVTFTYITKQDEIDVNAEPGDHEGLVEIGRNIEGVEVSVFIRQKDDTNSYKVSMRSKSYVNVSDVCLMFGGGGHPRAAGCLIQGDIEQVKQKIMAEIRKVL